MEVRRAIPIINNGGIDLMNFETLSCLAPRKEKENERGIFGLKAEDGGATKERKVAKRP